MQPTRGETFNHPDLGAGTVVDLAQGVLTVDFGHRGIRKFTPRPAPLKQERTSAAPVRPLSSIEASELHGQPVPSRAWHVPDMIPAHTVTLLYGDGGTGKSLLALQLAVATAVGAAHEAQWIGRTVEAGRVLYLSAEDDLDELHRRLFDIACHHRIELADFGDLKLVPLAGEDAILASPAARTNVLESTPLWQAVDGIVAEWKPRLIVLDTLADLFAGEENNRAQARQFIGLLRGLAIKRQTTIVMLAHPSLSGMASGSGTSGSTGWSNSVRSRLLLKRHIVDLSEPDPDLRILSTLKANYSRVGAELRMRWIDGVFVSDEIGLTGVDKNLQAQEVFVELLRRYDREGRAISAVPCSTYAPSVFARDARAAGFTRGDFVGAMNRLFEREQIAVVEEGPPSHRRRRIVLRADLDGVVS